MGYDCRMTNHFRPDYVYVSNGGVKRNPGLCSYIVSNFPFSHNHRQHQCRKPKVEQVGDYWYCRQHSKIVRRLTLAQIPYNVALSIGVTKLTQIDKT
jgi:hypothetical protein